MWKDPQTGLIWMRCSIGQEWNGSTCIGTPIEFNWKDANAYFELFNEQVAFGGKRDWRLPSIDELSTLRKCSKGWDRENTVTIGNLTKSTGNISMITIPKKSGGTKQVPRLCAYGSNKPTIIDTHIFPNTPTDPLYWSSSPDANNSSYAWGVSFYNGVDGNFEFKYYNGYVRAVRSGN